MLLLYLAIRFGDLALRGQLGHTRSPRTGARRCSGSKSATMAVVPLILFSIPRTRGTRGGPMGGGGRGGLRRGSEPHRRRRVGSRGKPERIYLPSWTEVAISAGVVSAAALAFLFMVERFRVWERRPVDPDADPLKLPEFDKVGTTWLGVPAVAGRTVYSLAFIFAAAVGFALLAPQPAAEPRHRSAAGAPGARRRDSLDRRQSGWLWRRVPPRANREAPRRRCVLREVPSHESAPGPEFRLLRVPPGYVPHGRRFPA